MSSVNASYVTPSDIIASYLKYGKNMISLDVKNARESSNKKVKYVDISVYKTNGRAYPLKFKFLNQKINNSVKDITNRSYEQIKLSFAEQSEFTQAMLNLSDAFKAKVDEMAGTTITSDRKNKNCVWLPSVDPRTPVQTEALGKNDEVTVFENPIIWVKLNAKRYSDSELASLPQVEGTYASTGSNLIVKQFNVSFANVSSGKPVKTKLDYVTCADAFTRNSIVSGIIQAQAISSQSGGFGLSFNFDKTLFYITADKNSFDDSFGDDDFAEMAKFAKPAKASAPIINLDAIPAAAPYTAPAEDSFEEASFEEDQDIDFSAISRLKLE